MSKILWNDLKTLYTELNAQRTKFKMSTISVPSKEGDQTKVSDITTLKDAIQTMTSHNQIGSEASTTSVIIPDQYSQMRTTPITQMRTVINRISNLSFNGTNFNGHDGSFRSVNAAGHDGSFRSVNAAGHDGGFRSVNASGHNSGHRTFSWNFSGDKANNQANVSFGYNFSGNTPSFGSFFSGNYGQVNSRCVRCFGGVSPT